ncbi:MAG: asparaginase [bacterium]|nr:asparaginase [bacterium]
MNRRPHVVIIFTGGTIASTLDKEWGGVVPSMSGGEILARIPGIRDEVDISVHEYGTFPGPHMTPDRMLELASLTQSYVSRDDVDGVVVTHGTDTLEETAFFLDCSVNTEKPIVVIGAMRNSSEPDWDGPRNVRDGLKVASSPEVRDRGVIVCLGGRLTAASEASKTDTQELTTFTSFDFGPLGCISSGHVMVYRSPLHRHIMNVKSVSPFVPLLKCFSGMDGTLVRACLDKNCDGIVIEAFGVGNVTPPVFTELVDAVEKGIPVVLTSRCPVGRIEHNYAYEGAGKHLHERGVIFADYLNGQKARIKLLCAIGAGMSVSEIRNAFEWVDAAKVSQ